MNSIDIANGIVFQKMSIKKGNFSDRLICQKKVYLLQSLGTNLGYTYNWYVRGPYSPSLTNYVYNNLDVLETNDFSNYKLAENAENNIKRVNELIEKKRNDLDEASWYELLASLLYISNNKQSWRIDDQENSIFSALISHKPQYSMEQCQYAFGVLCEKGFVVAGA